VNFIAGLYQEGGSFLSEDGTEVLVNSEAGIAALQKTVDLIYEYHVSPPAAGFDTWQGFGAGTVAVLPTGTWFLNQANLFTDINSRAWPNWQFGSQPAAWFGAHTFMIPAATEGEKLDAVLKMIQWVSENQIDWAASGQVPARLSAQAQLDPESYSSNILLGENFGAYGVQDPKSTVTQEMLAYLDAELSAALNGLKSPEDALNDAAERMQEALDRG
jgi:ABC-type glycerol-3-phosphate transport system substrate-binding protein